MLQNQLLYEFTDTAEEELFFEAMHLVSIRDNILANNQQAENIFIPEYN